MQLVSNYFQNKFQKATNVGSVNSNELHKPGPALSQPGADSFVRTASLASSPSALSLQSLSATTAVKFGFLHYCGVCPLCLAGAAARQEVSNIMKLKTDSTGLVNIPRGDATQRLKTDIHNRTKKESKANIGNADGTRLQPISAELKGVDEMESHLLSMAAMKRRYGTPTAEAYDLQFNNEGFNNFLHDLVIGRAVFAKETIAYSTEEEGVDAPPLNYDDQRPILPLQKNDKGLLLNTQTTDLNALEGKTLGIYHHLNEGGAKTNPLFIGYVNLTDLEPGKLLIPTLRELPGFEGIGIEIGGVMNALGLAATNPNVDSVDIFVEPWQRELIYYLENDLPKNGIKTKKFEDHLELPASYNELINKLDFEFRPNVYRIDVTGLNQRWNDLLAEHQDKLKRGEIKNLVPGNLALELLETISPPNPELIDPNRQEIPGEFVSRLPLDSITLSTGWVPDLSDLNPDDFAGLE